MPNYARPTFDPKLAAKLAKPVRAVRKAKKRKAEREQQLTRTQACAIVWRRAGGTETRPARCERQKCRREVSRDVHPANDARAQFNERVPRSRGGSPTDPDNIELTCRKCHFGGPSGAHAPTPERMRRR